MSKRHRVFLAIFGRRGIFPGIGEFGTRLFRKFGVCRPEAGGGSSSAVPDEARNRTGLCKERLVTLGYHARLVDVT